MSLKNLTIKEEHFVLENEYHEDYLKELVGTKYIKPEPFCSLDENDNKPANISRHDGMQSPFMEEIHDTDMKSELSIEEWKPVLKELVGIAPVTLQEHRASPMIQVKNEVDGHLSDVDPNNRPALSEPRYKEHSEEKDCLNDVFQKDVTSNSQSLSPCPKEMQERETANEESALPIFTETKSPKFAKYNLRGKKHKFPSYHFKEILFCDLCGKSFERKCHLMRHMRNHVDKQPYVCNVCGSRYSRTDSLRRHKAIHIPVDKIHRSHICDVCGKGFSDRNYLKRHSIVHGNGKAYLCDRCGKTFTQLGDMKRHATVHTGRELQKCDTCGKSFQKRMCLLRHQVHHNKDKLLYCNSCGRGFTRKDCLQSHIFQHMPQKPFICTSCGKGYAQSAALQAHIYKHLGQKPFSCADCEKCFTSAAVLRQHSLHVHTSRKSKTSD